MFAKISRFFSIRQNTDGTEEIKDVAKKRLQLLLVHDRVQIVPTQMELLKQDLLSVLKKYVEIDPQDIEIELQKVPDSRKMTLISNIPVKRVLEPNKKDSVVIENNQ